MGKGGLVLDIGQLNERKISTGWGYGEKELRLVCFTSKDYGKKKELRCSYSCFWNVTIIWEQQLTQTKQK